MFRFGALVADHRRLVGAGQQFGLEDRSVGCVRRVAAGRRDANPRERRFPSVRPRALSNTRHAVSDDSLFTVSPLTPTYVSGVAGLEELRPDVPAPRISPRAEQVRLLVYALAALVLAGYLAWWQGWLPLRWLGKRPFARAAAEMRRLHRNAEPEAQVVRARRLHRAFDEAAGFAVASHSLEWFFAAQPWSRAVEAEVREFFAGSDRFFYAGDAAGMIAPERLPQLARALAELEPKKVVAR